MKPSFLTAPFFMISYSDFLFFLLYFLLSFLMFCYFIFLCVYQNHLTISIWHTSIAFSAFSWLSGVTPAQHFASTMIGTSGRDALTRSALEITQISVHSPTNVMLSIFSSSFIAARSPARSVEPNVSLSIASVFLRASSSLLICQPSVSRMQCGTGSFLPSWVSRYQVSWVSLVKSTVPSKVLIFSSTCGTIATASFVPSAPSMKSFCISTTTNTFCISYSSSISALISSSQSAIACKVMVSSF